MELVDIGSHKDEMDIGSLREVVGIAEARAVRRRVRTTDFMLKIYC